MLQTASFAAALAALLISALTLVAASPHENDSMDMDMGGGEVNVSSMAMVPPPAGDGVATASSYFAYPEHTGVIYAHIAFMVLGWFFILPISVMLSVARSRLALLAQFSFLIVNALGLLLGIVYNTKTPDLYVNNAHHKIGWIATWTVCAQVALGLIFVYSSGSRRAPGPGDEHTGFLPVSVEAMAQHEESGAIRHDYRWSGDSGQGTERASSSLHSRSASPSNEREEAPEYERFFKPEEDGEAVNQRARRLFRNTFIDRFMSRRISGRLSGRVVKVLTFIHGAVDRLILPLGFVLFTTGSVTYGGVFRGNDVFNGLAHFIKGGIFFWYGLLTLGRWMGCFAEFGWAWNVKPSRAMVGRWKAAVPSAEFTESFVIFLYGVTNVFLEHLAAWGDRWAPEDFEHVAISVMFFGGGLCGMLIESQTVRDLLNTTSLLLSPAGARAHGQGEAWQPPKSYRVSLNPVPALIILLLGIMMSSHTQHSAMSSMVHKQWGNLLAGFSIVRAVTYVVLYLSPPTSFLPSRPPTELVSSFCLISGGLVFMASNKDTVGAMIAYDVNEMFAFTVTMGFSAFVMAWEVLTLAVKGWAVRKEANASGALGRF